MPVQIEPTVAYFSMEIALEAGLPTYSGGLGVSRAIPSARPRHEGADGGGHPAASKGYFYQSLDASGWQTEEAAEWVVQILWKTYRRGSSDLEGRQAQIRAWKYEVKAGGFSVRVYLLDSDLPENCEWDRKLTHYLYGGDSWFRLCRRHLGIGGGGCCGRWGARTSRATT